MTNELVIEVSESTPTTPNVKIITPAVTPSTASKSRSVIKGFDLSNKLNTPRSQSPASGRGTPTQIVADGEKDREREREKPLEEIRTPSKKEKTADPEVQYKKERGDHKEHLYMIVIGHVDAGKSTLMGHMLCALGQVINTEIVNNKTIDIEICYFLGATEDNAQI